MRVYQALLDAIHITKQSFSCRHYQVELGNEKKREILHFIEFLKQRQTTTVQRNWQTVFQITQAVF